MDLQPHPANGSQPIPSAAPSRRELPLVVGERTYRLVESMNAYCILEETLQARTSELVLEAASGSMRATRGLLWAHLQIHHRDEFPRVEQAGELVDVVGLDAVWQQLQALAGVTPTPAIPASRQVQRRRVRKAAH
jgi:hypothetical protein